MDSFKNHHDIVRYEESFFVFDAAIFIPVNCSNEARGTYSRFSGVGLNHKHLQLQPYRLFKIPLRLLM